MQAGRTTALRRAVAFALCGLLSLLMSGLGRAAVATNSEAFNLQHTGSVETGLLAVAGTFSNAQSATTPTISLGKFNPALGKLTEVKVTAATSTATFALVPTGLLSVVSTGTATRKLAFTVTSGTATGSAYHEVTTSGAALLTLPLGGAEIGGAPLAKSVEFTSAADLAQFTGTGQISVALTSTDTLSLFTLISLLNGASMAGAGTYAGTVSVTYTYTPWTISGFVYRDGNLNGTHDSSETGPAFSLVAKLIADAAPAGPALAAAPVDPVTGIYALPAVGGKYRVMLDDNSNLADVTPASLPPRWIAVEQPTLWQSVAVTSDTPNINFGLQPGNAIRGRVFNDNGLGGAVANDGALSGGETGFSGIRLALSDAQGNLLHTALTASDGSYVLVVPVSIAHGAALRVTATTPADKVSTGASIGNSNGTYDRTTDTLAFVFASNTHYEGLDFGAVDRPQLQGEGRLDGAPGTTLQFTHSFFATTSGSLEVGVSYSATTAAPGWNWIIYLDTNANGTIDPTETPVNGAINVTQGQLVALVAKVFVPASAPLGERCQATLQTKFTLTGPNPPQALISQRVDIVTVVATTGPTVVLKKSVDKAGGRPGDTLTYTINLTNKGIDQAANVVIHDFTPAFTTFVSASTLSSPSGLGAPAISKPGVAARGPVKWTFPGALAPGASADVSFTVKLDE